ncbi:hypothetical protein LVJ94_31070 [Pendulispora rubella]|uniref:Uncharacterized protein n=1 Tax=Pendulispora rubella TaxID=2741070 RepID=A0ABZ2KUC2_9BACT
MATHRRNLRQIVIDGVTYHWRSRYLWVPDATPLRNRDAFESVLVVFRALRGGRAGFVVRLGPEDRRAIFDGIVFGVPFTPRLVRAAVEFALARGWDPTRVAGFRELSGFSEPRGA